MCCWVWCRDLKSSNVLLTKEGRAKIADVGLAKLLGDEYVSTITTAGAVKSTTQWQTGPLLTLWAYSCCGQ